MKFVLLEGICLLHLLSMVKLSQGYKILLVPMIGDFTSRMMNMLKMADFLQEDGHVVSMVTFYLFGFTG